MAVLGWAPHWGFVVVFMRGLLPPPVFFLSFAVVLHVVFRVLDTFLRRWLHVSLVQVLVQYFLDATRPSSICEGAAA